MLCNFLVHAARKDWDASFSHPYVGALDGAGDAVFRPTRKG